MEQKLLTRLVMGALAGLAATGGAYAGQIQSSSVAIAREVITSDAQIITAPSIAYRFSGDVDARVQDQRFQVQFTIATGTWNAAPLVSAISVSDGVSGAILNQAAGGDYTVDNVGKSTDSKTVWATITVKNAAPSVQLVKQPLISINVTSNTIGGVLATAVGANRGNVNGLYTVAGDLVADYTAKNAAAPWTNTGCSANPVISVSFKHYTALSNPAAIATDANATPDEHTRSGSTNTATLITLPTNLAVTFTAATGNARINVAGGNLNFTGTASIVAPAIDSWTGTATVVNLGKVALSQPGTGYDSNLANQYLLTAGPGIVALATAATATGSVEATKFDVLVSSTNGLVTAGTLFLATDTSCGTAVVGSATAAFAAGATSATPTVPTAVLNATFGAAGILPIYVCYSVVGITTPIPNTSFTAKGTLVKSAAGANLNEQNNVCGGNLYSLGGGVKIDVRMYMNSAFAAANGGLTSVIRLINNNETRAIDVWGQIIHADGTYGPWGLLSKGLNVGSTTALDKLAPRQAVNLLASQVDALLTSAPAHATAANNGSATPKATDLGSRLRITSNAGSTLRVQNYIYNPATKTFFEASSTQGVDFEGAPDRAPASEGQYQDQDAQRGLNGG
jgi:hypothetical protein